MTRAQAEARLTDELLDHVKWVIGSTDRHGYEQARRFILDALAPAGEERSADVGLLKFARHFIAGIDCGIEALAQEQSILLEALDKALAAPPGAQGPTLTPQEVIQQVVRVHGDECFIAEGYGAHDDLVMWMNRMLESQAPSPDVWEEIRKLPQGHISVDFTQPRDETCRCDWCGATWALNGLPAHRAADAHPSNRCLWYRAHQEAAGRRGEGERPTLTEVQRVFNQWRVKLKFGAFDHADGTAFHRALTDLFDLKASGLPERQPAPRPAPSPEGEKA